MPFAYRLFVLVSSLAPVLLACTGEVGDAQQARPIPSAWTGRVQTGRCVGGTLSVFLDEADEAWEGGAAYFESDDVWPEHYRAEYKIEGTLTDGRLTLRESEVLPTSDTLPKGLAWCMGSYTFALAGEEIPERLSGGYSSEGCRCDVAAELHPVDPL